jgi:hypothetical protein
MTQFSDRLLTLEAFSHNSSDVATTHFPFEKHLHHISELTFMVCIRAENPNQKDISPFRRQQISVLFESFFGHLDLSFPIFVITIQHTLFTYYLIRKKVRCNFMMLDTEVSIAIHEYIRKGFIVYSSVTFQLNLEKRAKPRFYLII